MGISFTVNGTAVDSGVVDTTPVMYVLRNDLGLVGVRAGCSIGECGACTVLLDGEPIQSCSTPVSEVAGGAIVTPEGLAPSGDLHPIQEAFLSEQAAQCGYCINGMIVRLSATLEQAPEADDATLVEALSNHLCRCGTHDRILRAAERSAGRPRQTERETVRPVPTEETPEPPRPLPAATVREPNLDRWLQLRPDGGFDLFVGRIEFGQGIRTSLQQIAAAQLDVAPDDVSVQSTRTDLAPDEGYTSASISIEEGGRSVAIAANAMRGALREAAAAAIGAPAERLVFDEQGLYDRINPERRVDRRELHPLAGEDRALMVEHDLPWRGEELGMSVPRRDLPAKLTGSPAYVHDLLLPGTLFARALMPPTYHAQPRGLDITAAEAIEGVVEVVVDGRLILVIAEREDVAIRGVARLERDVRWSGGEIDTAPTEEMLRSLESTAFEGRVTEEVPADELDHHATFLRSYQAHGPMAPSAAVAHHDEEVLRVWTHSQGVYPLRRELATLLDLDDKAIIVEHRDGPGCYGFTCADDAAAMAAIAARAVPGRPVQFRFSIEQEFGWEPLGPAMLADLAASLDDDGRITAWQHRTITDAHSTRPNGDGDRLVAAWLRADSKPRPWGGPAESGVRNAVPPYAVDRLQVVADHVRGPLRTGALRTLGSHLNVFAMESFVDQLAEEAGRDPVAFRLENLDDPRARRTIEVCAQRAGWTERVGPSGRGMGIAYCRYKDSKAYVAVIAEVSLDPETGQIAVTALTAACDAGLVVNEDGLRNQIEGGLLQGVSRTLHEAVTVGRQGPRERDWTTYPVLRFDAVPSLEVVVIDDGQHRALGVGEASTPAVAPAIANAVDDVIGVRIRSLPFGPSVLERRMLELSDSESARVLM